MQPSQFKGAHLTELHCHTSRHTKFATLLWTWNNLSATVVAYYSRLQCLWPDNTLGFGTRVRTSVTLFSSLALKNSSQTSYRKSFCSRSWRPYESAISSSPAMVSQSVSSSTPLTPNKIQLWKYVLSAAAATSHKPFKRSPLFSSRFPQQFPLYYII